MSHLMVIQVRQVGFLEVRHKDGPAAFADHRGSKNVGPRHRPEALPLQRCNWLGLTDADTLCATIYGMSIDATHAKRGRSCMVYHSVIYIFLTKASINLAFHSNCCSECRDLKGLTQSTASTFSTRGQLFKQTLSDTFMKLHPIRFYLTRTQENCLEPLLWELQE